MKITVAGEAKEFEEGLTVRQLIDVSDVDDPLYVTVALNDEFLRQETYEETVLHDGDEVEFLYFMGGGAC